MAIVYSKHIRPAWADQGDRSARSGGFGVGVALVDPTGLSAKFRLSRTQSIEGAVGWSRHRIQIHGHYTLDEIPLATERNFDLGFSYAAGARLTAGTGDDGLGLRFPAGLVMNMANVPFDFFGQLALVVKLIPATGADLELTIGTRYFFD